MAGKVGTYFPDKITVIWGPIIFAGWAKGSFVKVGKPEVKQVSSTQGADGHVARAVRGHQPLRPVSCTLLQTSDTNLLLMAQVELDRKTGLAVYPLTIKDLAGTTLYEADQAWIAERPEGEFAQDATNREWILEGIMLEVEGQNS